MTGHIWYDQFVADGPGYHAHRYSVAEVQALLLKAGIGAGLPLGHAQDFSVLAPLLMSDAQLFAMATAALDGPHLPPHLEGTDDHIVAENPSVLMAAPIILDHLVSGARRAVIHNADWPMLFWPYLTHATQVYETAFAIDAGGKGTVTISVADRSELDSFNPPQPVPDAAVERLTGFAAKTYVPSSEASRSSGAGAGLNDND